MSANFIPSGITDIAGLVSQLFGRVDKPLAVAVAPTITFGSSPMGSAQALTGTLNTSSDLINPAFGVYGCAPAQMSRRLGTGSTGQQSSIESGVTNDLTISFYTNAKMMDLIIFQGGQSIDLWIDDVYISHFAPSFATGTAQAGAAATITLTSGASATNGFYDTYYVRITGGTGTLNETRLITGYIGATKVATVASNWTTPPDATTTYSIEDVNNGFAFDNSGTTKYVNLAFTTGQVKKITLATSFFRGVNVGPNDSVWAGPPVGLTRIIECGDSFVLGTAGPRTAPTLGAQIARLLACQMVNLSAGGTGWNTATTVAPTNFNFQDRLFPPVESWIMSALTSGATSNTSTGGTYALSITFAGSTQTTSALAWNASAATVLTALQALSNVTGSNIQVARGDAYYRPMCFVFHNMAGAMLTIDPTLLTGGTASLSPWVGDLLPNVPKDASGLPAPFIMLMVGSGNDYGSSTTGQVQTNATYVAAQLATLCPQAVPIWVGQISNSEHGAGGVIDATDIARNAALKAAATAWGKVNGAIPFIDTYANGVGGNAWVFGSGTVGNPTTNKNDILIGLSLNPHPTGDGAAYYAARIAQQIKALLGAA